MLLGLTSCAASCGETNNIPLTQPTPAQVAAPAKARSTFGLSGTISEATLTGLTPLAGATVEILGHTGTTNAQGFYNIPTIESNGLETPSRSARPATSPKRET
jgi:hypothetical protein